jgi:hypothetical protein
MHVRYKKLHCTSAYAFIGTGVASSARMVLRVNGFSHHCMFNVLPMLARMGCAPYGGGESNVRGFFSPGVDLLCPRTTYGS